MFTIQSHYQQTKGELRNLSAAFFLQPEEQHREDKMPHCAPSPVTPAFFLPKLKGERRRREDLKRFSTQMDAWDRFNRALLQHPRAEAASDTQGSGGGGQPCRSAQRARVTLDTEDTHLQRKSKSRCSRINCVSLFLLP